MRCLDVFGSRFFPGHLYPKISKPSKEPFKASLYGYIGHGLVPVGLLGVGPGLGAHRPAEANSSTSKFRTEGRFKDVGIMGLGFRGLGFRVQGPVRIS